MTRPPRLSVCMICKDGEAALQASLPLLAKLADELIFVDTGSTDGSVALARRFGASIHHFAWTDDFATARNEALRHATGDWIFMADCDDLLAQDAAEQIRAFLQNTTAEGCYIRYENEVITLGRNDVLIQYKISLFRNRDAYRYRRPLHETIEESIRENAEAVDLPVTAITILHRGYADQHTIGQKNERNMRIVQKALQQEGESPDLLYCLGIIQLQSNDHAAAWQTFCRVKSMMTAEHPLYAELLHKMATCQLMLADPTTARDILNEALALFPDYTDLYYHCAGIDFMLHDEEQAIHKWQQCIQLGEGSSDHLHLHGTGSFLAWHGLAQAYTAQKRFPAAVDAYLASLRIHPGNEHCLKQLLIVLADHFSYEEALDHLAAVYAVHEGPTLAGLVSAAVSSNRAEFAYQLLAAAEDTGMDGDLLQALAQLVLSRLP